MEFSASQIRNLHVGVQPELAVSGAFLIQDERRTILTFNAVKPQPDGRRLDAGTAVVTFQGCQITKFGYPNDEAYGPFPWLQDTDSNIVEILDSPWPREIARLNQYAFPDTKVSTFLRHFLFLFHDSSFECLADDFEVTLDTRPFRDILLSLTVEFGKL